MVRVVCRYYGYNLRCEIGSLSLLYFSLACSFDWWKYMCM